MASRHAIMTRQARRGRVMGRRIVASLTPIGGMAGASRGRHGRNRSEKADNGVNFAL
ncbi:hypothetical protein V473_00090 [Sphingobium cupriresistens LL01]|uniref:Uncharacterized protein n=1 Tax=Sphingobium cupriresistens LL01 TaxID=1420583 RepID=A0A0J7Y469_9SPHN|nr:hypothetical protein V473_00090 [Sphingobium cupriresistens LL01]